MRKYKYISHTWLFFFGSRSSSCRDENLIQVKVFILVERLTDWFTDLHKVRTVLLKSKLPHSREIGIASCAMRFLLSPCKQFADDKLKEYFVKDT